MVLDHQTIASNVLAPELDVEQWFNTDAEITLDSLRGRVVVVEAFQMLCPGCVAHGLPQARRVHETFGADLTVLGLHTVFEHHAAMTPVSLQAFLHEYQITFPVGVDRHEVGYDAPVTMRRFGLRGTPSLVVMDRAGCIRTSNFGQVEDLSLGALLAHLLDEAIPEPDRGCEPSSGCEVPTTTAPDP